MCLNRQAIRLAKRQEMFQGIHTCRPPRVPLVPAVRALFAARLVDRRLPRNNAKAEIDFGAKGCSARAQFFRVVPVVHTSSTSIIFVPRIR